VTKQIKSAIKLETIVLYVENGEHIGKCVRNVESLFMVVEKSVVKSV